MKTKSIFINKNAEVNGKKQALCKETALSKAVYSIK